MKVYIAGETEREISEDLNDGNATLLLCSLYNNRRVSTKLHLFFDCERSIVLAVLVNDGRLREIYFSDEVNKCMHNYLLCRKNEDIGCNYMSKWEFLDSNTLHYERTGNEECELGKLLINKKLI